MEHIQLKTDCCICGGGPAGIMLGFLLARAGIDVTVLEKHKDFFRDFRGDTIHPSTMQLMFELNLLDDFLKVPHQELQTLSGEYNDVKVQIADFSHLKTAKPVLGLMPQWDFLNFISSKALKYPGYHLYTEAKVEELIKANNRITGIKASTTNGMLEVNASVVIGADGRSSTTRSLAGLKVISTGAPIDVLWFRLSRKNTDTTETFGRFNMGRMMILLQRDDYWQIAFVIAKGDLEKIKTAGLEAFKNEIVATTAFLNDRINEINNWDQVKLLSVAIDHLEKWYCDGLLCIGDAAHAMSPVGGVGINLAIQDAVSAANILYEPLLQHQTISTTILKKVQQRRSFPTRMIQRLQVFIQNGIIKRKTNTAVQNELPLFMKLLKKFPILQRIPARVIGIGIRPEHIKTPKIKI
jgi:2-polyprenyl-6-methoxyphenol hydroxylase-like FAD-dependent oxidoreductase